MKLRDLGARLIRTTGPTTFRTAESFADAHGVIFDCPLCQSHSVIVWFAGIDARDLDPAWEPRPRWVADGTSVDDLTLRPSVDVKGCWHGFVRNGDAE